MKVNYVSHKEMSREQFRIAVKQSIKNSENIQAIALVPYVPFENRNVFEGNARKEGFFDFTFIELHTKLM